MSTEISSRYRNPGCVYFILGLMLLMNIGSLLFLKAPVSSKVMSLAMTGLLVLVIFGATRWQRVSRITIDRERRTIRWGRFFSEQVRVYSFDEINACLISFEQNKNGKAKVLRLMKNGSCVKKISGFTYANVDELEGVIGEMMAQPRL